jgi:hypothetical protein
MGRGTNHYVALVCIYRHYKFYEGSLRCSKTVIILPLRSVFREIIFLVDTQRDYNKSAWKLHRISYRTRILLPIIFGRKYSVKAKKYHREYYILIESAVIPKFDALSSDYKSLLGNFCSLFFYIKNKSFAFACYNMNA